MQSEVQVTSCPLSAEWKEGKGMPAWHVSCLLSVVCGREEPPSGVNTFPQPAIDMAEHRQR